MTIAEIHGKISGSGSNLSDRLEDLLTSDVFGPLRYLPFAEGLQLILREARLYSSDCDERLGERLIVGDPENAPVVCFWPKLQNSEPDVVIGYGNHLLLVEAKYLSGKSGESQLAREFSDLMTCRGPFSERSLVYLTAHREMPKGDIENSYNAVRERHPEYAQNTYWLSWFDIHRVIENEIQQIEDEIKRMTKNQTSEKISKKCKKLILEDIKSLLYKKGFRGFEGFSGLKLQEVEEISERIFYQRST